MKKKAFAILTLCISLFAAVALLWCVRMMRRPRKKDSGDAPDNALR